MEKTPFLYVRKLFSCLACVLYLRRISVNMNLYFLPKSVSVCHNNAHCHKPLSKYMVDDNKQTKSWLLVCRSLGHSAPHFHTALGLVHCLGPILMAEAPEGRAETLHCFLRPAPEQAHWHSHPQRVGQSTSQIQPHGKYTLLLLRGTSKS